MRALWLWWWGLSDGAKAISLVVGVAVARGLWQMGRLALMAWVDRAPRSGLLGVLDAAQESIVQLQMRAAERARLAEAEREEVRQMRGTFVCVHCGQPCGVTGHVRTGTRRRPVCASTEPMLIVRDHRGREFGFCCPPGHTCMFGSAALVERRRRGDWRNDLMTQPQWDYLLALGYRGERPKSKGQAKDLLQGLLDGAFEPPSGAVRGITVRDLLPPNGDGGIMDP